MIITHSLIKNSKVKLCLLLSILIFIPNVKAKTMVEKADVCGLKEVYRDYDTIEEAIGKNEYLDSTIGNKDYCLVYCVESDTFTFPGFMPTVNSGNHFTWTIGETIEKNILSGYTVNLKGKRNCRTEIDLKKWIKDYLDIQTKITAEVNTLKKPLQDAEICPPSLGSRGCGMVLRTSSGDYAGAPTTFIKAGGLSNYISSSPNGGSKLKLNEMFGLVKSNKHYNVYTFTDPGSLYDGIDGPPEDLEAGVIVKGYSYWVENQDVYDTLCPCEWRSDGEATYKEVGRDIDKGPVDRPTYNAIFTGISVTARLAAEAQKYADEYSSRPPSQRVVSDKQTADFCSNAYGGSTSSCNNDFWGLHESFTKEQAVQTKVSGSASATATYNIKEEDRTRQVPDGTEEVCTFNIDKREYECEEKTKYKTEHYTVYVASVVGLSNHKYNIDSIQQEICIGDTSDFPANAKECAPAGKECPAGYHIGADEQCNKTDTSYLRTLIEKQKLLIDILKNCSSWDINYYNLDTDAFVDYEEPVYGRTEQLDKKLVGQNYRENHKIYGKDDIKLDDYTRYFQNSGASVSYWGCNLGSSNRNCKKITVDISMYWLSEYGKEYTKEYDYYLSLGTTDDDYDFYRYVLLPQGISVDSIPKGSEYETYGRFIDIGYANYPVHFNTSSRIPRYNLDIYFDKVGQYSKFSNDVYNKNYLEINNKEVHVENYDGNKIVYDCEYNVNEGAPYCPTNGCEDDLGSVRIVYRPISLENPFPGISGEGRNTGNNWCTLNSDESSDCNKENETVEKYILNNRNTSGSSIYTKDPMYEITLNPSLIKSIREYNKSTNYDDFNLICDSGAFDEEKKGRECRSHFVVGGMDETNLPSLKDYFAEANRCGTDSEFNACDELDGIER